MNDWCELHYIGFVVPRRHGGGYGGGGIREVAFVITNTKASEKATHNDVKNGSEKTKVMMKMKANQKGISLKRTQ